MSVFDSIPTTPVVVRAGDPLLDDAQLAAVAFLARYGGRTLESYRADLRQFFQWTARVGLAPLAATRAHIELYRAWMEHRGPAASTVDRRLSTVCGYYRFAHLDGRIPANPALHVRRPPVHPSTQRGMDRGELAAVLYAAERISPAHAALAVLLGLNGLRVSEACGADVEDLGFETWPPHTEDHRQGQPARGRTARAPAPHAPLTSPSANEPAGRSSSATTAPRLDTRTAYRWVRATGRHAGLDDRRKRPIRPTARQSPPTKMPSELVGRVGIEPTTQGL